jgi:hypothetical protein
VRSTVYGNGIINNQSLGAEFALQFGFSDLKLGYNHPAGKL